MLSSARTLTIKYEEDTVVKHFCSGCSELLLPGSMCTKPACTGKKEENLVFVQITDPFCKGVDIVVGRAGTWLCPVAAILDFLHARGTCAGALFPLSTQLKERFEGTLYDFFNPWCTCTRGYISCIMNLCACVSPREKLNDRLNHITWNASYCN